MTPFHLIAKVFLWWWIYGHCYLLSLLSLGLHNEIAVQNKNSFTNADALSVSLFSKYVNVILNLLSKEAKCLFEVWVIYRMDQDNLKLFTCKCDIYVVVVHRTTHNHTKHSSSWFLILEMKRGKSNVY